MDNLDRTRTSLSFTVLSINRYYRKDNRLVTRAQILYDSFVDFRRDCEQEFKRSLES